MSILNKKWLLNYERSEEESLWSALLNSRKIEDPGTFFSTADPTDLHDPFLFKDMEKAVERLQKALHARERIVIYGDYDVDGTSGSALLVHTLRMLGGEVSYRIPHRRNEGYGLHAHYIEDLAKQDVKVLITVDLGISCPNETALAQSLGIDVILTDHHTIPAVLPQAFATLHPKLEPSYPFHDLSGSGVAFKLASGLLQKTNNADWIPSLTDLASLGTVADCVSLHGENRTLVKLGLEQMKNTKWEGLRELLKASGAWDKQIFTTHTIGFQIGPRLNASGRMDNPLWSLQTLLAVGQEAHEKSLKLEGFNKERQDLMTSIQEEVEAGLNLTQPILILSGKGWSSGLVGLIAGRIQEKYGKPTFILEDQGEVLTGSARSLPGFNAVDALRSAEHLLEKFGGHELAAGFHLKKENYPAFVDQLQSHAKEQIGSKDLSPVLNIDLALQTTDFTRENAQKVENFAPFGVGNPEPIFLLEDIVIEETKTVGAKAEHLQFYAQKGHLNLKGIAFRFWDKEEALKKSKKLLVKLHSSTWTREGVEVELVDAE